MILRRITKHVRSQNWFAVGIDFLIVVIGVFIGIQVANWNESRVLAATENAFLQRLHAETQRAGDIINSRVGRQQDRFENLSSALDKLYAGQSDPLNAEECLAIAGSFLVSTSLPLLPSVEELQESHGLGLIRDPAIRTALSTLSQATKFIDDLTIKRAPYARDPSQAYPELIQISPYRDESGEVRIRANCNTQGMINHQGLLNALTVNLDFQDTLTTRVLSAEQAFVDLGRQLDMFMRNTDVSPD